MISCYRNKTENRRKNKLTLRKEDNVIHPSKIVYLLRINCYRNSRISLAYLSGIQWYLSKAEAYGTEVFVRFRKLPPWGGLN